MDSRGNEEGSHLEPLVQIDVRKIEQFLKQTQSGEEAKQALRYRTMVHWLHPELDRLSSRMLPVYTELLGHLKWPFSILDVGCMTAWLHHFLAVRTPRPFKYTGVDVWPEALDVAREFQPYIDVRPCDVLKEDLPTPHGDGFTEQFKYTWCSNIQFGKEAPVVIRKLVEKAYDSAFFGMPDYCGDYAKMASDMGYKTETYDCGEAVNSHQYLVRVWQ